jgi:hypothetical protein
MISITTSFRVKALRTKYHSAIGRDSPSSEFLAVEELIAAVPSHQTSQAILAVHSGPSNLPLLPHISLRPASTSSNHSGTPLGSPSAPRNDSAAEGNRTVRSRLRSLSDASQQLPVLDNRDNDVDQGPSPGSRVVASSRSSLCRTPHYHLSAVPARPCLNPPAVDKPSSDVHPAARATEKRRHMPFPGFLDPEAHSDTTCKIVSRVAG